MVIIGNIGSLFWTTARISEVCANLDVSILRRVVQKIYTNLMRTNRRVGDQDSNQQAVSLSLEQSLPDDRSPKGQDPNSQPGDGRSGDGVGSVSKTHSSSPPPQTHFSHTPCVLKSSLSWQNWNLRNIRSHNSPFLCGPSICPCSGLWQMFLHFIWGFLFGFWSITFRHCPHHAKVTSIVREGVRNKTNNPPDGRGTAEPWSCVAAAPTERTLLGRTEQASGRDGDSVLLGHEWRSCCQLKGVRYASQWWPGDRVQHHWGTIWSSTVRWDAQNHTQPFKINKSNLFSVFFLTHFLGLPVRKWLENRWDLTEWVLGSNTGL